MKSIDAFLAWTAWAMEKPKSYGPLHLGFTIIGLALSLFFAWRLRKLGDRGNRILLSCCGLFLLVCEVYKMSFLYWLYGHHFDWTNLSFQMCSVPMYLCLIAPWVKNKRLQKAMYSFMMMFNLLGGFVSFIEPSGLLKEYWTLTLHALTWHMSLVFIGLYLAFSGRGGRRMGDFRDAALVFVTLCGIAFVINCLAWNVELPAEKAGEHVNMFFVGPANSSLIVFKQISEACGWFVSTLLYIPSVCLGAFLFFLPFHLAEKKKAKIGAK